MTPWKKTFVSAFAAQVCSIIGFSFALPFLPFFLADLGIVGRAERGWWAGIVMSAAGITLAIFSPLWGHLADRYGRKVMVMRAMFGGTVVMLLMSMVQSVGQLVVCRLLQGALTGTVAASVALVASITPTHRSGFALGMMQAAVFIGVSIGPLFGGLVADHFGYRVAFRIGAAVLFLGGILIHYGTDENFSPPDPDGPSEHLSYKAVLRNPAFVAAVVVLTSIRLTNTLANPSFPLIIEEILKSTARVNTVTGSVIFAAAMAGALSAGLLGFFGDSWGHRRVLLVCAAGAAVVSLAHTVAYSIPYLTVVRMLFGLTIAGMIPAANAIIRNNTHDASVGKAYGVATSISMAGLAVGPFLGGYLIRTAGLRTPFLVSGIGQAVVILIVLLFVRDDMSAPGRRS